jgi:hypothetical protein
LGKTRVVADAGESERKVAAAMVSAAAAKLYFLIRKYQLGRSDGEKLSHNLSGYNFLYPVQIFINTIVVYLFHILFRLSGRFYFQKIDFRFFFSKFLTLFRIYKAQNREPPSGPTKLAVKKRTLNSAGVLWL